MRERLGRYRLVEKLGSGGMGTVYLAESLDEIEELPRGSRVALKVILPHLVREGDFVQRFLREAEYGRRIVHPNVVRTLACETAEEGGVSVPFLVMEHVEGQTLHALRRDLEVVPEELCRRIALDVASGLEAIHRADIVHRDLKPANVMITARHDVKIMDLGVARLQDELIRLSRTGQIVGSVPYAAPEAFGGRGAVGPRSDLFSLGLVLYELATGVHPFRHEEMHVVMQRILTQTPRRLGEVNPQVSPFFEEVVHTLLAKDPDARFAGALELAGALETAEDGAWWKARMRELRRATHRPVRRIRLPRPTRLHGREEELDRLRRLQARAARGEGQVVLVRGEAGIGKTRLVDELVTSLEAEGVDFTFLFGAYAPGGAATTVGAFSAALREHFGDASLDEELAALLVETPLLVPSFAALLRGVPPPQGSAPLSKEALQRCFATVLARIASERPTVCFVDGLHDAPDEGRALFAALALAVAEHPILLIGTLRPDAAPEWSTAIEMQPHVSRIDLHRLGAKDLASLLEDCFRSSELAAHLGHQIALKSDGNPFFVFEIVRSLRESGAIAQVDDGSWGATREILDIRVPETVLDLVHARVLDLEREDRELLDVAACAGFEFDPLLVARAAGLERLPALKRFAHVEKRHRIVRSAGRRLRFDHQQIQEALYEALIPALREEYHLALARGLEAGGATTGPEGDGPRAQALCHHYFCGGDPVGALPHLDAALRHLDGRHLHTEGRRLLRRALDAPGLVEGERRAELLLRLAAKLDLGGLRDEQSAALEEAHRLADAARAPALEGRVGRAQATLLFRMGRFEEAARRFGVMRDVAQESGDRQGLANALGGLGTVAWALGRYDEARPLLEEHLALARELGDVEGELRALGNLGNVFRGLDQCDEAIRCFQDVIGIARSRGHVAMELASAMNLGSALEAQARYEEAREVFVRGAELAAKVGDRQSHARIQANEANLCRLLGDYERAAELMRTHVRLAREFRDPPLEYISQGNLGSIERDRGDLDGALQKFRAWRDGARAIGDRSQEATAEVNLGLIAWDVGRLADAEAHWEQARSIAEAIGNRQLAGMCEANQALVDGLEGRTDDARCRLEGYLAICRELRRQRDVPTMLHELAKLDLASDRRAEGEARLGEALAAAQAPGLEVHALVVRVLLAALDDRVLDRALLDYERLRRRVDVPLRIELAFRLWQAGADQRYLEEARALLARMAARAPLADRESLRTRRPLYRAVDEGARKAHVLI